MDETDNDNLVDDPTWFGQIRYFFTDDDVGHMNLKGIDLATYDGVKANAVSVYSQTQAGSMPPEGYPKWSAKRVQTFLNWITGDFPLGTPPAVSPDGVRELSFIADAGRVRRDIATLDAQEITTLKIAFRGIMVRDPARADSYFAIAGVHWFPAIDQNPLFHCLHHEHRFLAWHRLHLRQFEDALRSVEGCNEVTLPYWDVTKPVPAVFFEEPFAAYALQAPIGHEYDPLTTSHYKAVEIEANMQAYGVASQIASSMTKATWELFNRTFWQAHDNGHVASGTTMENQDISSFDPIFWLFHCNLDRIWLEWQKAVGATTLAGFKSTCREPTAWLDIPALAVLPPFSANSVQAITMSDVAYEPPAREAVTMTFENRVGHVQAHKHFRIEGGAPLSIRVKDINRSGIPGSFVVHLLADGEEVARQAFFQPTDPGICPNCTENANVSIDFRVAADAVVDKELSVELHVPGQREIGTRFPISKIGTPTINVRHLLDDE